MITTRENDDRRFHAALHGVRLDDHGATPARGGLRAYHDRMTRRVRGAHR